MEGFPIFEEYDGDFPIPTKEAGDGPDVADTIDLDDLPLKEDTTDICIDISNRSMEHRELAERDMAAMLAAIRPTASVAHSVAHGIIGAEDFSSVIANGLTGIANVFGHLTNLFAVSIFRGWRDFKRSELADYVSSNTFTMPRLYRLNYADIRMTRIPYPEGMVGGYLIALSSLKKFLDELNMVKTADRMCATLEAISADLSKTNQSFKSHVADFNKQFVSPQVAKAFRDTDRYFTSKKETTTDDAFGKRFANMGEFESAVKMCIGLDDQLRAVSSVHSRMRDIESVFGNISNRPEKMNRQQVEDLVKIAKTLATTFDAYATVINDVNRVGHNLMFVIKALRAAADV